MENYSWESRFSFPWEKCEKMTKDVMEYLSDAHRIIDIGFGRGYVLSQLRETYPEKELVGLDIIPRCLNSGISSMRGSIENLPYKSDSFDGVICTFVLDYVDREKSIGEIRRILKENRKAVLLFHHPEGCILRLLTEELMENPEDKTLRYFVNTLNSNIFKSSQEFEKFMRNSMLIDYLATYFFEPKDSTKKEEKDIVCYAAHLINKNPIWNIIPEPTEK